jgi:hypothetical protein
MATNLDDDRRELAEAEQRLFAALGLERRSERLTLADAPVVAEGCAVLIEEAVSNRPETDHLPPRPDRCHPGG